MAKRVPAPGWHLPQVVARFALLTIERGSDDGRIRCTPWHEAQLATVLLPARDERPWKLSSKDETTLLGRLNFSVTRRSPWQRPQVMAGRLEAKTGEPGSFTERMRCSPWQSVQTGASSVPWATAWPWTLAWKAFSMPAWQVPQVSGTFWRFTFDFGSDA